MRGFVDKFELGGFLRRLSREGDLFGRCLVGLRIEQQRFVSVGFRLLDHFLDALDRPLCRP